MAEAAARGAWNTHEMIQARWDAAGLNDFFRSAAPTGTSPYIALDDKEYRPGEAPGPYCVYETADEKDQGGNSGLTADTFKREMMVAVTFRIHTHGPTAKDTCVELTKEVAKAFDPRNQLPMGGEDGIICGRQVGSNIMRENDQECVGLLVFEYTIDATYNLPPNGRQS